MAGRQSARQELADSAPPCLPLELIKTSFVELVSLAAEHKYRMRSVFGDAFVKEIFRQHRDLVRAAVQEALKLFLFKSLDGDASRVFEVLGSLRLSF